MKLKYVIALPFFLSVASLLCGGAHGQETKAPAEKPLAAVVPASL
jgi:hypothetical protein